MFEFAIKRLEKKISLLNAEILYNGERKMKHLEYNESNNYEYQCISAIKSSIKILNEIENNEYKFNEDIDNWLDDYFKIGGMHINHCLMEFELHRYSIGVLISNLSGHGFDDDQIVSLRRAIKYLQRDAVFYACFTEIGKWMRRAPIKDKEE